MLNRIRQAMATPYDTLFHGTVMADEAYIGGDPSNRHAWQRREDEKDGRGTDKTPVVTLIDKDTGEVRSHVATGLDQWKLGKLIIGNVERAGSVLVTDGWKGYNLAGSYFSKRSLLARIAAVRCQASPEPRTRAVPIAWDDVRTTAPTGLGRTVRSTRGHRPRRRAAQAAPDDRR
jgi:hypothetical protein